MDELKIKSFEVNKFLEKSMNPYLNQPCRDDACEELLQNFKLHVSGKFSSMPFSIFKRIEIHA